MHEKTATRMAVLDTHIAMQMAKDGEQQRVFLDCGSVGKVQYSGLTRFLHVETSRSAELVPKNVQVIIISNRNCMPKCMPVARPKTLQHQGHSQQKSASTHAECVK